MRPDAPGDWSVRELGAIADILLSNVNKKTAPDEIPVKLCNYMDVYSNAEIIADLNFMAASATVDQVQKFGLRVDDVIITKDSEDPTDIAVPAIVAEPVDSNLVCGYHLAILRPIKVEGRYLCWALRSRPVRDQLSRRANGSTRFGLTKPVIGSTLIPLPPVLEQKKIATILSSVDDAIAAIRKIIEQTKRVKQGLLQTLMTRGIGHTRFKKTEIGETPEGWVVVRLGQLVHLQNGRGFKSSDWAPRGTPIIKIGNLNGDTDFDYFDGDLGEKHVVRTGDLLFSWSGSRGTSFGPYLWWGPTGALNQHIFRVDLKSQRVSQEFLFQKLLQLTAAIEHSAHGGAGLVHVKKSDLVRYPLALPPLDEQAKIVTVLAGIDQLLASQGTASRNLDLARKGLLQDLLTGRVRVPLD